MASKTKPCLDCGQVSDQARCPTHRAEHQRARDAKRGSASDRGYGRAHKLERERWRPKVEAGGVECWRCHDPIDPSGEWDLGHVDADKSKYEGPEHVLCNRRTSGRTVAAPQRWEL